MPAITDVSRSMIEIARLDGVPPEHVGHNDDAPSPWSTSTTASSDVVAAAFHIVIGANGYGPNVLLRSDNVLCRGDEFIRESAVGYQHHANQGSCSPGPVSRERGTRAYLTGRDDEPSHDDQVRASVDRTVRH